MTKAFLKMARAQAATTAYRDALDIVRRHPDKEAQHLLLAKIAEKKQVLDDWRRQQEHNRDAAAEAEYREANALLEDDTGMSDDAHEYKIDDDVLYRVNDGLWLPAKIINITPRRIVIRPHGYLAHRNTLASQLRPIPKDVK
jgi:hypothetical protein